MCLLCSYHFSKLKFMHGKRAKIYYMVADDKPYIVYINLRKTNMWKFWFLHSYGNGLMPFMIRWTMDIASVWMRFIPWHLHSMLLLSWIHTCMHILHFKPSLSCTRTWERGLAIVFVQWDQILTACVQKKRRNGLLKLRSFKSNGLCSSWRKKISYGDPKGDCQRDLSQFYALGCFRISSIREFLYSKILNFFQ